MRKRKLPWLLAGMALASVSAFVLWPRPERITQANCDRIRVGMSRAEVEAILGGPPGDYRVRPTVGAEIGESSYVVFHGTWTGPHPARTGLLPLPAVENWPLLEPATFDRWQGDAGNLYVTFAPDGVRAKSFSPGIKVEQSPLDNLLWRLRRQWRRWLP